MPHTVSEPPAIDAALGARKAAWWHRLHADLEDAYGPLVEKWSYHAKADRWSLQVKRRKGSRTILYLVMAPERTFLVAVILGEKAVAAARAAGLPSSVLDAIDASTSYPEGRLVWTEITRRPQLADVLALARVKMQT